MARIPHIQTRHSRGFTLIEVLLAIFILGLVLTTIYSAYTGVLRMVKEIDEDAKAYKMARIALDRINRDVSGAWRYGNAFVFQADKTSLAQREFSSLALWSTGHLVFDENEQPGQPASIAYFVKEDREGGMSLWRSDVAEPKPSADRKAEGGVIICRNLQAFKLKFFDEANKDYDTWNTDAPSPPQKGRPPLVVQVELALVNARDAEKPYRFITKIFLPVRK